jgi:hypothetical protein
MTIGMETFRVPLPPDYKPVPNYVHLLAPELWTEVIMLLPFRRAWEIIYTVPDLYAMLRRSTFLYHRLWQEMVLPSVWRAHEITQHIAVERQYFVHRSEPLRKISSDAVLALVDVDRMRPASLEQVSASPHKCYMDIRRPKGSSVNEPANVLTSARDFSRRQHFHYVPHAVIRLTKKAMHMTAYECRCFRAYTTRGEYCPRAKRHCSYFARLYHIAIK